MKLLIAFVICVFLAGMPAQVFAVEVDRETIEKYSYVCGPDGELCSPMGGPLDGPVYFEAPARNLTVDITTRDETVEVKEFKAKYGGNFTSVDWDEKNKRITRIYGYYDTGRGELKTEADAEALARDFLSENAGLFKIDMTQMEFKNVDGWMVDYNQYYNGIPVYDGKVRVRMNGKGVLKAVKNNFYPDINISTEPKITKEEAARIAEDEVGGYRSVESVEPYIFPRSKDGKLEYRLTWRTYFKGAYFFVDALNGEIIHKEYTVVANGGVSIEDGGVNDEVVSEDAVTPTPAQTEGSSSSPSKAPAAAFVGLATLAIAAILIIWRLKK